MDARLFREEVHPQAEALYGPRYRKRTQRLLYERLRPYLREGVQILDAGGGRDPFLPPELRPARARYVGTDIDPEELAAAPPEAYDECLVSDITKPLPTDERFDVVITWQVLEHVDSMQAAIKNLCASLAPGGVLFAYLSGSRAFFAVATHVVPYPIRVRLMKRLLKAAETDHFPTVYNRCTADELRELLAREKAAGTITSGEVVPFYRAANYLPFNSLLRRTYLVYENRLARRNTENFASHYLVVAGA